MKELAIGEVGEVGGVMVMCMEGGSECHLCAFEMNGCCDVPCFPGDRNDGKHVYFEEIKNAH